ncbi:WD40-repeat-containing domain protein [Coprinopsis sp. MPI-PUGE-AT-0042]|nr:WD40-repeat-containing domain protein [Coprinopsis sp. MPI-PUGE-AT-0042]
MPNKTKHEWCRRRDLVLLVPPRRVQKDVIRPHTPDYADPTSTITLPSLPFDSISCIRWSPVSPDQLMVSSWDTTVRLYDIGDVPYNSVLTCAWGEGASTGKGYSGGLDTSVRELDLNNEKITHLGKHDDSVSSMAWGKDLNGLVTGSWDRTIRFWDPPFLKHILRNRQTRNT